jgi:hypothetical protein
LGAVASGAGDDFHHRWVAREVLRLLDPDSRVTAIKVEGLPKDEVHQGLGEHGQAVDVTLTFEEDGEKAYRYLQLKYSPSHPAAPWSWSRLLQPRAKAKPQSSVLGKLAGLMASIDFAGDFSIVTNQPLADEVARDIAALLGDAVPNDPALAKRARELRSKLGLDSAQLRQFLGAWDLAGFEAASRLDLQTEVVRRLADATDADARADAALLQQHVTELMLPEGVRTSELTRETILVWLGAGAKEIFFPAPSRITPPSRLVHRAIADRLIERLRESLARPLRLHADGGCGKTSLITNLGPLLPTGSELFVYDCYGGGLFLAADQRRHLPGHAFTQMGNEIAGRLRTPFVIRRNESLDAFTAFHRRVTAASAIIAERDPAALLVIAFDAVDNARIGADHWQEPCFLDALAAASGWPDNVRILVTCRNARLDRVGAAELYEDFAVQAFELAETETLVALWQPRWPQDLAATLHELTGGNPRRLTYALEGLGEDDAEQAVKRLLPRATGIDPLFAKRVEEAGVRLGGATRIWPMLSALARLPRPVPAEILAAIAGLEVGDILDIANDVGGITRHPGGWSFHDEDFEDFVDTKTSVGSAALLDTAADLLVARAGIDDYAARAIGEVLVAAGRLEALYALVTTPAPLPPSISAVEAEYVRSRRLTLGLRACRTRDDIGTAAQLLIASAEGTKRQKLLEELIAGNLDLSTRFEPEAATRLVMTATRYRKRRARFRIESAAALAPTDLRAARNHYRWWSEYLEEHRGDRDSVDIAPSDLAAEYHFARIIRNESVAIKHLMRWHPLPFVARAFAILVHGNAGTRLAPLIEAIELRNWPPAALAPLIAAALLAGGTFDEPVLTQALARLAAATCARWAKPIENMVSASPILAWHEATLFLCERALPQSRLHGYITTILAKAFPRPQPQESHELYRLSSAAARHARILAIEEVLTARPIDCDAWLPPVREVPKTPPKRRQRYGEERQKSSEEHWNEARLATKALLERMLRGARASLRLVTGDETDEAAWTGFHTALDMSRSYDGRRREADAALLLLRAHLLHSCLAGHDVTALRAPANELLRSWHAARPAFLLDIARSLALTPAGHDAALDLLVALGKTIATEPGSASHRSSLQIDCARAALPIDEAFAQHFFKSAIDSTEKVDSEALSELAAARAAAKSGLGGTRAERLKLAQRLGDAAGAVVMALDLGGDFAWSEVAKAMTEADLGAGLAAVSRWHDLGVGDFAETIPALLSTPAIRVLTVTQRYALSFLAGDERPRISQMFEDELVPESILAHDLRDRLLSGDPALYIDTLSGIDKLPGTKASPARLAGEAQRQLFLSWHRRYTSGSLPASGSVQLLGSLSSVDAIAAALDEARRTAKRIDARVYAALAARISNRRLRVPFLEQALVAAGDEGELGFALPDILSGWRDYPPVAEWARTRIGTYVASALRHLFTWQYEETEDLEALLEATGLPPVDQAEIILDAIAQNTERLSAELIFALVGVVAARAPAATRNTLLADLLTRIARRAEREPLVRLTGDEVPEDGSICVARMLFAAMGDVDRRVRWRAAHAALQLIEAGDPAVAPLIRQFDAERETSFSGRDFYLYAAREQLMTTLWRAAETVSQMIAPYAADILAHLRRTPHLIVREAGRGLLLGLAECGAIRLDDADRAWLESLNRSTLPVIMRTETVLHPGGFHTEEKKRAFRFDTMDTVPYWYQRPAALFGLPMEAFLDRVEAWIHGRWGYGEQAGWWKSEPRLKRIQDAERHVSNRHGTRPMVERLSRYLEWHGMMCAVGELIDAYPLAPRDHYDEAFDEWRDRSLPSLAPAWLSDLRTPPPMEPRFWGYPPAAEVAPSEFEESPDTDPWPRSLNSEVFEEEVQTADGAITIAGDYTLRWSGRTQNVDIHSALVTPETAAALAQALLTARDRMDFSVPGVDEHSESDKPGYQFIGWLKFTETKGEGDRHDPARGTVQGIAVEPDDERAGRLGLSFDRARSAFTTADGKPAINLAMWGAGEDTQGHGWRATASSAFLERLAATTGMSVLICAEISRRRYRHDRSLLRTTRWALWLYEAGSGLRRIHRIRRGLGPWLIKKAGMERSTDTHGRWLLHRAAELDAARLTAASPEEARAG